MGKLGLFFGLNKPSLKTYPYLGTHNMSKDSSICELCRKVTTVIYYFIFHEIFDVFYIFTFVEKVLKIAKKCVLIIITQEIS